MKYISPFVFRFPASLLVLFLPLIALYSPVWRVSASLPGNAADLIRPCKLADVPQPPKPSGPKKKKTQGDVSTDSSIVCLEIRSSILEVQEVLQAKVRELRWNIHDETLNESSWMFLRDLTVEELLSMTKDERRPNDVEWRGGSTTVQISATEIGGGFTRTIIKAQFRGSVETKDKFKVQHEWWPLDSNGSLEEALVAALRKHFVPVKE